MTIPSYYGCFLTHKHSGEEALAYGGLFDTKEDADILATYLNSTSIAHFHNIEIKEVPCRESPVNSDSSSGGSMAQLQSAVRSICEKVSKPKTRSKNKTNSGRSRKTNC